jgi:DNA-directed RNA polymerase subunit RPC12/RpoP
MSDDDVSFKCPHCGYFEDPVRCVDCHRKVFYADDGSVHCPSHGRRLRYVCNRCSRKVDI